MNKKEAYKLLIDGKKVTKRAWRSNGKYLYMNDEGDILNQNNCNEYLNDYGNESWEEYIEDNRKEIPWGMDYLKDLYSILHRKYGRKIPCIELVCKECPLNTYDDECLQIKIRKELERVNEEWKLDK